MVPGSGATTFAPFHPLICGTEKALVVYVSPNWLDVPKASTLVMRVSVGLAESAPTTKHDPPWPPITAWVEVGFVVVNPPNSN